MNCRAGCAACCIVVSISSPIPGMPGGKPAGVRCAQLTADNRCRIYGCAERPRVCSALRPTEEVCSGTVEEIFIALAELEQATQP